MRPQSLLAVGLAVLLPAAGCESPTTGAARPRSAQFDFMNGPADLPNVFRGDSVLLFVWADVSTNYVIVVNAPTGGVHALRRCGGALTPEPQPVQTVGEMQDVLRQLRLLRDVNIHIYSPVPSPFRNFMDLCQLSPYARSEEHTSELQSHHDLVCRLLLEKKNKKNTTLVIQIVYNIFESKIITIFIYYLVVNLK